MISKLCTRYRAEEEAKKNKLTGEKKVEFNQIFIRPIINFRATTVKIVSKRCALKFGATDLTYYSIEPLDHKVFRGAPKS